MVHCREHRACSHFKFSCMTQLRPMHWIVPSLLEIWKSVTRKFVVPHANAHSLSVSSQSWEKSFFFFYRRWKTTKVLEESHAQVEWLDVKVWYHRFLWTWKKYMFTWEKHSETLKCSLIVWDGGAFRDISSHNTINVMFPQNPRQYHQQCDTHTYKGESQYCITISFMNNTAINNNGKSACQTVVLTCVASFSSNGKSDLYTTRTSTEYYRLWSCKVESFGAGSILLQPGGCYIQYY